jgi:hypothetical protein
MGAPLRKSFFQQKLLWYEQREAGQSTPGFPFSHDCAGSCGVCQLNLLQVFPLYLHLKGEAWRSSPAPKPLKEIEYE